MKENTDRYESLTKALERPLVTAAVVVVGSATVLLGVGLYVSSILNRPIPTECQGMLPKSEIRDRVSQIHGRPYSGTLIEDFNNASCNFPDARAANIQHNTIVLCNGDRTLTIEQFLAEEQSNRYPGPLNGRSMIADFQARNCPADSKS